MVWYMKEKKILLLAAKNESDVIDRQCDIVYEYDSIKEAKERAKYYVSGDYEKYLGADADGLEPIRDARIEVNGDVHSEYYKKGYAGRIVDRESGELVAA